MIQVDAPLLPQRDIVLQPIGPVRDSTPGPDGIAGEALEGRIALGGPVARRLTAKYLADDPVLREFVERPAGYDYYLVHLSVSFNAGVRNPRLASASVELMLSAKGQPDPIALSMYPSQLADTVHIESGIKIGPQLSLLGVEGHLGEVGKTVARDQREVFLQGLRVLRSNPGWEFRRTKAVELAGMFVLALVVRAEAGAEAEMDCVITASTKANVLRWYRQQVAEPLRLHSSL